MGLLFDLWSAIEAEDQALRGGMDGRASELGDGPGRSVQAEGAKAGMEAEVKFELRETQGSIRGRAEVEVFAPDGWNFDGPHSLIVRDATLLEAKRLALKEAELHRLVRCSLNCECR